jgi:hypothetical protein
VYMSVYCILICITGSCYAWWISTRARSGINKEPEKLILNL